MTIYATELEQLNAFEEDKKNFGSCVIDGEEWAFQVAPEIYTRNYVNKPKFRFLKVAALKKSHYAFDYHIDNPIIFVAISSLNEEVSLDKLVRVIPISDSDRLSVCSFVDALATFNFSYDCEDAENWEFEKDFNKEEHDNFVKDVKYRLSCN